MVNWRSQRILIIGAARQGIALVRFFVSRGAQVVLTDRRNREDLEVERATLSDCDIEWHLGGHPLSLLNDCSLICPSAGVPQDVPILVEARANGIPISNDSQIFLEIAPCKVLGITGSAGKTTTISLVGKMVEAAIGSQRTWVGGNIGNPLISDVDQMEPDHIAVIELSSFQLEIMTRAPQVAAVLNITPNHLDRHKTMEAYTQAKAKILHHQTESDIAVLCSDDAGSWGLRDNVQGDLITFGKRISPLDIPGVFLNNKMLSYKDGISTIDLFSQEIISLRGDHNLVNVLAACAIAKATGLPDEAIQAGVQGFMGVEHRLEYVRTWQGADWYNDSIATAPERAMAAIRAFDQPLILLVGGRDKDLPWGEFADLVCRTVDHLIVFGEAKEVIVQAIKEAFPEDLPLSLNICSGLGDAVSVASHLVEPGDVVLLSPGGTSFDEFSDFSERGDQYRKWVNELP